MNLQVQEFLTMRSFAIAGSFKNNSKIAYKILLMLKNKGCKVYPINPTFQKIENLEYYKELKDIPAIVDVVVLVTPPSITEEIVKKCYEKGISMVWMQPGAENKEAIDFCKENNIKIMHNACILVESNK